MLATIKSDSAVQNKLKSVTSTFEKYGEVLAPTVSLLNPMAGVALKTGVSFLKTIGSRDQSLSDLRKTLLVELEKAALPIVVLIDELDRIEDQEIRTVAQLVRSVADFRGISYLLAYDHDRVVQALGEGDRGRAYLEKIVQLQIPLPITFEEEIIRLLSAELIPLQEELHLPSDFHSLGRYKELLKLLSNQVIETPRDIKRLVGAFHVLCGMLYLEVDWIDLLAYSALLIKAPGTVGHIRSDPGLFCEDTLDVPSPMMRAEQVDMPLADRLSKIVAKDEDNEGTRKLIGFLFPSLSNKPRDPNLRDSRDALCLRRPLLTTLRLGQLPGGYSKADILSLVAKEPEEIKKFLDGAHSRNTLAPLIDRLNDLYGDLADIDHVQFWEGVANFVRKPDCLWMESFSPMSDVIRNFADVLLFAAKQNDSFRPIAAKVFTHLQNAGEDVLTATWLRVHIFMYGLFGRDKREDEGAFLTSKQTEACAHEMSSTLRLQHLDGRLIPCRWDLEPVYTMVDIGVWDESCRARLEHILAHDSALDGFTLMLFGPTFRTSSATIEKMCSYEIYIRQVTQRRASPSFNEADPSVQLALKLAKNDR